MVPEYKIDNIDYWEGDAFFEYQGKRHYFQFGEFGNAREPTLADALTNLFLEGKIMIKD